jgi:hypothetical protein
MLAHLTVSWDRTVQVRNKIDKTDEIQRLAEFSTTRPAEALAIERLFKTRISAFNLSIPIQAL